MKWNPPSAATKDLMTCIGLYGTLAAVCTSMIATIGFWPFVGMIVGIVALLFIWGGLMWVYHKLEPSSIEYTRWFAWRPVKTWHGPWIWLAYVERRGWTGIYREIGYTREDNA